MEVSRDMTQDVKKDKQIKLNETKYSSLLEDMPIGVLKIDSDFNISYLSPYLVRKLGFTMEEVKGEPATDFINERDIDRIKEATVNLLKNKENAFNTFKVKKKNGGSLVLEGTASLKPREDGKGWEFLIVATDATEKLQQQENYNSLFVNINSGVVVYLSLIHI